MNFQICGKTTSNYVPLRSRIGHNNFVESSTRNGVSVPAQNRRTASLPSTAINKDNKWFREPKIPVHMNSSTLIRMKSRNQSVNEVIRHENGDQLAITAKSFLKRDRRMSDCETSKGISPFDDGSFIKNVFLNIVSIRATATSPLANAYGDGGAPELTADKYHRVAAAVCLNDRKSGCNLKYVEEISIRATTTTTSKAVTSVGKKATTTTASSRKEPRVLPRSKTIDENGNGDEGDDDDAVEDEKTASTSSSCRQIAQRKKLKKRTKAVVVTCIKNTSVKFVKKTNNR